MDRVEAIEILAGWYQVAVEDSKTAKEHNEALDLAIDALSEPQVTLCKDCTWKKDCTQLVSQRDEDGEVIGAFDLTSCSWAQAEDTIEVLGDAESATTTDCISRQEDMGEVSDGYHTFNQLYHQRAVLFATIVNQNKDKAWKSWKHEDGKFCFDKNGEWFIVGIDTPEGSYTYHYEQKYWDMFDCEELDRGKHWDGHTEKDVTRLLSLPPVNQKQVTSKLETAENATSEGEESTMNQPKSKLDCISREQAIAYIDRVTNSGLGRRKSLDYIRKYISALPPVNQKQITGKLENAENATSEGEDERRYRE